MSRDAVCLRRVFAYFGRGNESRSPKALEWVQEIVSAKSCNMTATDPPPVKKTPNKYKAEEGISFS